MIVGRQIRAARALLDMSQDVLAEATGLTPQAIRKIENGDVQPREGTIADIMRVFDERGLEFTENTGVRMKPEGIDVYDGIDRFNDFYDFMFRHLSQNKGDVCLNIHDESILSKFRKNPELHRSRMKEIFSDKNISFKILTTISDFNSHGYAEFREQTDRPSVPIGFYAFGECLALMSFVKPTPYVVVIKSAPLAEGYRQSFYVEWKTSHLPKIKR